MLEYISLPVAGIALIALALVLFRPTWGMLAIAAIYPVNLWAPRLPVPGLNSETILVGVLMGMTLLRFGVRLPPLRYTGPVVAFMLVVLASFVLAVPWARVMVTATGEEPLWKIFQMVKAMVFTSFLFFPAYWWFGDLKDRRRMLQAISVAGFTAAVFALIDFVIPINPNADGDGRAMGLFDDPNGMAQVVGISMFPSLYLIFHADDISPRARLFHFITYVLSGLAVVASLSRGNWLAMVIAHAAYFFFVNRRLLLLGTGAFVITLTIAFPFLPGVLKDRVSTTTRGSLNPNRVVYRIPGAENLEGSAAFRLVAYRVGMDMFRDSPIWGHGLHFFNFKTPEYGAKYGLLKPKDAHSLPLTFAVDTGLIGIGVLLWVSTVVVLLGLQLWRLSRLEYGMGVMLLGTFVHIFIANLSSTAFLYTKPIAAFMWIQFGICARAYGQRFDVREDSP